MKGSVLETIGDPECLRRLRPGDLGRLAGELREELIRLGSESGGHFAASLGTVELTIGLHYVFDTPRDRLIWDVGHQAHGHKMLTGRRGDLARMKQRDGPSGFLRRCDSPHDAFGTGHAGTSVSAGAGIAEAARRKGEDFRVVVVIGDGAATEGMSFEALNHLGELRSRLRVVFNDNGMSIAPSVGGLARFGRHRDYFESLGLDYSGPVDGHDLDALLEALRGLAASDGPAVLHVKTRKGYGYPPSERDPFGWHATGPFEIASGSRKREPAGAPPSWTSVFAHALERLADRDPRVVAITAAMPDGTGLDRFARKHPSRVYDVGIAEQHAVTFAAGLAAEGLRPVCAVYSAFLQRAFDQIVHDVALQNLPVIFALDRAGLVGGDGPTHHGVFDLGYLRMIPNLVVAAPRDENELQHLLATAVEGDRPFAIRFPRGAASGVALDPDPKPLPLGRGEILRSGDDVALVAIGKAVSAARAAAELLEERGISAAVVDARFAKPLDGELLTRIAEHCRRIVTVEDNAVQGGFGSAVLELLGTRMAEVAVQRLGVGDEFVAHGDVSDQWRSAGIDADSIARSAAELVARERTS
jgi:1-deoxy-D-xylulose-5-phosphate synthase